MNEKLRLDWPLMENNITEEDLARVIAFLGDNPKLTQGDQVQAFEREWSDWLGCRHSVFVNSGSSANLLTFTALRHLKGTGEVVVAPFGWISDIACLLQTGFQPVFADINPRTLGLDTDRVIEKLTPETKAVLLIHAQGFNALTDELMQELERRNILLIEDVCESHGATHNGRKCGTFGLASNFSFYYAHHLSTIEGGMICTDDSEIYQVLRMARSHGMVREASDESLQERYVRDHPELNKDFIFALAAYNVRGTEIQAVMGRHQLPRLATEIDKRNRNWQQFLRELDSTKYRTDFANEGSSNYAFNLVLCEQDEERLGRVKTALAEAGVEFRQGSSGGGNQLRQPYLSEHVPEGAHRNYPVTEHMHRYGFYIGNYPDLNPEKTSALCQILNAIP